MTVTTLGMTVGFAPRLVSVTGAVVLAETRSYGRYGSRVENSQNGCVVDSDLLEAFVDSDLLKELVDS